MSERKKPSAIGDVFKGAIGHMAYQAWLVGQLDAAIALATPVLEEAKANMARNQKDTATATAVARLQDGIGALDDVARDLARIAVGGG